VARKTVSFSDMDIYDYQREARYEPLPDGPVLSGWDYVSAELEGSPYAELLLKEIRIIATKAGMTHWQKIVWECSLRGYSNYEIGEVFQRDESSVRQALEVANIKAEPVRYKGMITSMIEHLGWEQTKLYLNELLDQETPLHKDWKLSRKVAQKRGLISR
jgi:hypothetical protein